MTALAAALAALGPLAPRAQLEAALARLRGGTGGPLGALAVGDERTPHPARLDGRLLEALSARALGGARGAVFTPAPEARLLAAAGLAVLASRRGFPSGSDAMALLLGGRRDPALARALDGATVLDPSCGGGALLAAAALLAGRCGATLALRGIELSPLAARSARERIALLGLRAGIDAGDAFRRRWPRTDLVLANPPFLRHEAIPAAMKARAASVSGLSRQADLAAHFAAAAIRAAPVAAVVWPAALAASRAAEPLLAEARARGGFPFSLGSDAAGSFAASVETRLVVWAEGCADSPAGEARVPLASLDDAEAAGLLRGAGSARVRLRSTPRGPARGAGRLDGVCAVRFGTKTGCNAFFQLAPLGGGRFRSPLAGEVELRPGDVVPLLASLKEARAPEVAEPARVLFRPVRPSAAALAYIARGEAEGIHRRATCAGRAAWWRLAPGRAAAPVLYPAKIGARAFAFLNTEGLWEDKKWHVLFPAEGVDPASVALLLGATPVRLAIDEGARQLTGKQAIADVDCRVLAAAPFPGRAALASAATDLAALGAALAREPVTTDLAAMLERPAQRELDRLGGRLLGLAPGEVEASRRGLRERVARRLARAAAIRATLPR